MNILGIFCTTAIAIWTLLAGPLLFVRGGNTQRIHLDWKACRNTPTTYSIKGCSAVNYNNSSATSFERILNVPSLPTTALLVLLNNQKIPEAVRHGITVDNLYRSKNLALLPDISIVNRKYYTLWYERSINPLSATHDDGDDDKNRDCTSAPVINATRQTLQIQGINYRATAYLNGNAIPFLGSGSDTKIDGMFRRHSYDVTEGGKFSILVDPPLNPGLPEPGQGGNHALAQDGPVPQFMAGWDWCAATPDRSTGFYGSVVIDKTGPVAIRDPSIQTLALDESCSSLSPLSLCQNITLLALLRIECVGREYCAASTNGTVVIQADWGEEWTLQANLVSTSSIANSNREEIVIDLKEELVVQQPESVHLWWPHDMVDGPNLHSFTFKFVLGKDLTSDIRKISVGIRTIETRLDERLQGQTFWINGHKLYLVGGNWITTDQTFRYSASPERYCNELALHRHAGLNLIRVWGGGVAESNEFYDCADSLGLLVFQEFWMTGDNNGRWAGSYKWPLNYQVYLDNVLDTVLRLRQHASLLFFGGCNECLAPSNLSSPPLAIDRGIRDIIEQFDHPGRFYIPSSMGGPNIADTFENRPMWMNRSNSLAFADGPYSMQYPATFFEKNPGLFNGEDEKEKWKKNVSIAFQPEVGSASAPTYEGLLRFLTEEEANTGVPNRINGVSAGDVWGFHSYQPWTTLQNNVSYDHVYAYFGPSNIINASDWCAAAQLAAHAHYQYLFTGFISHIFEYTTAVIFWKSQSPWPSLRGFLYDWYLESTGTLRGVRAALSQPVSVALDASSWRLRLINRGINSWPCLSARKIYSDIGASYEWFDIHGKLVLSGQLYLAGHKTIPPMNATLLGNSALDALAWPSNCSDVCFLSLRPLGFPEKNQGLDSTTCHSHSITPAWYWLSNPAIDGLGGNFSLLGEMRNRSKANATFSVDYCVFSKSLGLTVQVDIQVLSSSEVLFYPTFSVFLPTDQPLFPLFDDDETNIVLLPGTNYSRRLRLPTSSISGAMSTADDLRLGDDIKIRVRMNSWNRPSITHYVACRPPTKVSIE